MYLRRALDEFDGHREGKEDVDQTGEESLTHQSFKEESDINVIVKRFGITGLMPGHERIPLPPGDYEYPMNYLTAQLAVKAAEASFYSLPADIRAKFDNDPIAYADYGSNPENQDQMAEWGLAKPREKQPDLTNDGRTQIRETQPEVKK